MHKSRELERHGGVIETFPDIGLDPFLRSCAKCGEAFSSQHSALCEYCFWKAMYEEAMSVPERIAELEDFIAIRQKENEEYKAAFDRETERIKQQRKTRPLWMKLLGLDREEDRRKPVSVETTRKWGDWRDDDSGTGPDSRGRTEIKRLQGIGDEEKEKISKQYQNVAKYREEHQRKEEAITSNSQRHVTNRDYSREKFLIRDVDYRRGNPLDNHFRGPLFDTVVTAFGGCCVVCESRENLTLDHFAITKNSGGNFLLWIEKTDGLRLNLSVLCRSCNASKKEQAYDRYFTDAEINKIFDVHGVLLEQILHDSDTRDVIRKWYRK